MSEHESKIPGDEAPPRYQFAQLTLTPSGSVPLIKQVLDNAGDPLSRGEIVGSVEKLHVTRGGKLAGPGSTTLQVKKALSLMRETGQITQVGHRHYIAANSSSAAEAVDVEADDESDSDDEIEDTEETGPTIKILNEIGEGAEKVYVYFFERDRELATHRNEDFWPCKIGYTKTNVLARILGQGAVTSMHSFPIVGLVIHTDHSELIEKLVHNALRLAGRAVPGSPGTEWFHTTPDAVRAWYLAFIETLRLLGGSGFPASSPPAR